MFYIVAVEPVILEAVIDEPSHIETKTAASTIQVTNPERVGDKEPFVVYTITSVSSFSLVPKVKSKSCLGRLSSYQEISGL